MSVLYRMTAPKALRVLLAGSLVLCAPNAKSDEGQTAAALFSEGRALLASGQLAEACARFKESDRLEPAPGTKLNLADCYERQGRLASARTMFVEAESAARSAARASWADIAKARAGMLEPRLPKLTIHAESHPGAECSIDGILLSPRERETPIPLDPGLHVIEARKDGAAFFHIEVQAHERESLVIDVPEPPKPAALAPSAPLHEPASSQKPAAKTERASVQPAAARGGSSLRDPLTIALASAGAVAFGIGTFTGIRAMSKNADARSACPRPSLCLSPDGVERGEEAHRDAFISTVAFASSGAFLVSAALVRIFWPSAEASPAPQLQVGAARDSLFFGLHGKL